MKLSEIKTYLKNLDQIAFKLPNGKLVPSHFHVTEVGKISKKFIDCGGSLRLEETVNFQIWEENDYDHRLLPEKLLKIITKAQDILALDDLEIEVEYQGDTIGKYNFDFDGENFVLLNKATNCLAKDNCGIPEKPKRNLRDLQNVCAPNSDCC